MSARDDLAAIVDAHVIDARKSSPGRAYCSCEEWHGTRQEHRGHVADAILAAGWRPPKKGTVTEAREALDTAAIRRAAKAAPLPITPEAYARFNEPPDPAPVDRDARRWWLA
jgi:hypothetical protein